MAFTVYLLHEDSIQSSTPAELFEKMPQNPVSCLVCNSMKEQMTFPGLPGFDLVSLSITSLLPASWCSEKVVVLHSCIFGSGSRMIFEVV